MLELPEKLIKEISSLKSKGALLIGIDGSGGAGKSTYATKLAHELGNSQVIHIDDFYKPKEKRIDITEQTPLHSNFEFERLKRQVLEPLGRITIASFQTPEGMIVKVQPKGYVIVEGLGTLGIELRNFFDYKIWIESSDAARRQRGIERDSEDWTKIWDDKYLPQDARYVKEQAPQAAADWILNNN